MPITYLLTLAAVDILSQPSTSTGSAATSTDVDTMLFTPPPQRPAVDSNLEPFNKKKELNQIWTSSTAGDLGGSSRLKTAEDLSLMELTTLLLFCGLVEE
ncbi:hypothetical protein TNCV_1076481 [Trichonephila clavipes]|uniref:Uncharacterized protein n=1 Tax=Trichonephila clavipes TaxID=2585209 RepID=A0A8X6V708_TRICX|nr:hypothetical protein TNCV_1076481 [Trichonephila clavipes]